MDSTGYIVLKSILFFVLTALFAFIPDVKRDGTCFGVPVPKSALTSKEITKIKNIYRLLTSAAGLMLLVANLFISASLSQASSDLYMLALMLLFLILSVMLFMLSSNAVKTLKKKSGWVIKKSPTEPIDTSFTEENVCPSSWWFLPHVFLIAATAIMLYALYPYMPDYIPNKLLFFSPAILDKSFYSVCIPVLLQIIKTAVLFGLYMLIKKMPVKIDPANAEKSLIQNRRARFLWSSYMIIISFVTNIALMLAAQFMYITPDMNYLCIYVISATCIIIILSALILSAVTFKRK